MALFTLRAAGEVRTPQFGSAEGELDAEMVAIAGAIIRQRTGHFDPSTYRDRYQEALQQLIEAKTKGLTIKSRAVSTPSPVIDLMAALKRSLAQEPSGLGYSAAAATAPGTRFGAGVSRTPTAETIAASTAKPASA
jgi:DNA end-binding protein Ku